MKKILLFFRVFFFIVLGMQTTYAQDETPIQTFYIDFGFANTVLDDAGNPKGAETTEDGNGNFWNNVTNPNWDGPLVDIVNSSNVETGYQVDLISSFGVLGKDFGGLETPDASKLNDIAVGTATEDYFVLGYPWTEALIQFKGLDPEKAYRFTIFGSRGDGVPDWTSGYKLEGVNISTGTLQTSTNFKGNEENVFISEGVYPNADGDIMFTLTRATEEPDPVPDDYYNAAYVNLMKIEEIEVTEPYVAVTGLELSIDPIDNPLASRQANVTITPENATVQSVIWTSSDETIATVSENGMINPISNGTVSITATSTEGDGAFTQTVEVEISNQTKELYVGGAALDKEGGQLFRNQDRLDGSYSNLFYAYVPLIEGESFYLYTLDAEGVEEVYGVNDDGKLVKDGYQITVPSTGPFRIKADFNTGEYELLPISRWTVIGTQTEGTWGGSGIELEYQGESTWSSIVNLARQEGETYNGIIFKMNGLGDALYGTLSSDYSQLSYLSEKDLFGGVININIPDGEYRITLDFEDYSFKFEAVGEIDPLGITFVGSSVAQGWGSEDGYSGYAKMYSDLLIERADASLGESWNYKNVSIGGDNTIKVKRRYNIHVPSSGTKYVVYGLSLANEGIMSGGQPIYDQFRDNLLELIAKTREDGKVPVIMNNYANGLYDEEDYVFIKNMNLLIHEWDVPSFNALGSLDNGVGQFVDGEEEGTEDYESDTAHPNTLGHKEFFHGMVPSLFDALHENKPLPVRQENQSLSLSDNKAVRDITYTPDGEVHSFTNVLYFKTDATGQLITFTLKDSEAVGTVSINENGFIQYTNPNGETIIGESVVNDDAWHMLTLTHYHAREKTILYIDKTEVGTLVEQLVPEVFKVTSIENATSLEMKDLFFYRAGMNADEINAIAEGRMLKSSLEVYVPLSNEIESGQFIQNLAQSTVELESTLTKLNQVIDFGTINQLTYGDAAFTLDATSSSSLEVTFTSSDESILAIEGKTASILKAGTVTVTAEQSGSLNYNSTSNEMTLEIAKKELGVTTDNISISYGDEIPAFTINYNGFLENENSDNLTTIPTVTTTATSTSDVGSYDLVLGGGEDENYDFSYTNAVLTIGKANQSIDFELNEEVSISKNTITLEATATSNLEVVYSSSDESIVSINGDIATLLKAGSVEITVNQVGNTNYNAAEEVMRTLTVTEKEDQTITNFDLQDTITVATKTITLEAEASSGLSVSYTTSDASVISIEGNIATVLKSGEVILTATQDGNDDYNKVSMTQSIVVNKLDQTLSSFLIEDNYTLDVTEVTLNVTASSDLEVIYTSSDTSVLSIDGNVATLKKEGVVTIIASQLGDDMYNETSLSKEVSLSKVDQTLSAFNLESSYSLDQEALTLDVVASSGLEVMYTSSDESVLSIEGNIVSFKGAGVVTITASQLGNDVYTEVTQSKEITLSKADQTLSAFNLETSYSLDQETLTLDVVASSGLEVIYTSSDVSILSIEGNVTTLNAEGEVTITATQNGDDIYNSTSESITITITESTQVVEKMDQTLSAFNLESSYSLDQESLTLDVVASSGLEVMYTSSDTSILSVEGNVATLNSEGEVTITATQSGDDTYNAVSNSSTITITAGTQEVEKQEQTLSEFNLESSYTLDINELTMNVEASSGLEVVYTTSDASVLSIEGNVATLNAEGEVTITATQAGNEIYNEVIQSKTITLSKADQTISNFDLAEAYTLATRTLTFEAVTSSMLDIVYTSSDASILSIDGNVATLNTAGTVTITVSQEGNDRYNPVSISRTITLSKIDQLISDFTIADTLNMEEGSIILEAVTTSELPLLFSSSDETVISIDGNIATLEGVGQATITVLQEGNEIYNATTFSKDVVVIKTEEQVTSLRNEIELVNVYPNPTASYFKIDQTVEGIQIYSSNGNLVRTFIGTHQRYDVSDLSVGTYSLLIKTVNGTKYSKLLIE